MIDCGSRSLLLWAEMILPRQIFGLLLAADPNDSGTNPPSQLPDHIFGDLVATFAFGLLAILLVVLGFKVFDWLTPKCNFQAEINKGNISVGLVMSAVILGISYIIAHVISGILGS